MPSDFFSAIWDVISAESTYNSGARIAILLLFVAAGEWVSEKAGALNISVEGMLLGGAFAAGAGYHLTGWVEVGIILGAAAGLVIALVQANMSHRLTADQFVVGLTLNILVLGIASFLNSSIAPDIQTAEVVKIPLLSEIPIVGSALFEQRWPAYLVYLVVPACAWLVYRTRWGLEVRAVGENPQSADVSGIRVNLRRRQAVCLAGLTSGIGGAYLLLGWVGNFQDTLVGGRGFIAIAAVIFGGWTLRGTILGCLLFGMADSFRLTLPALGHPLNSELLSSLPYLLTIFAVAVLASRSRQPGALGLSWLPFSRQKHT